LLWELPCHSPGTCPVTHERTGKAHNCNRICHLPSKHTVLHVFQIAQQIAAIPRVWNCLPAGANSHTTLLAPAQWAMRPKQLLQYCIEKEDEKQFHPYHRNSKWGFQPSSFNHVVLCKNYIIHN